MAQGKRCVWCEEVINSVSWEMFSFFEEEWNVCLECKSNLDRISGEICLKCGRLLSKIKQEYIHGKTCVDCQRWVERGYQNRLVHNRSLFEYNDFMKQVLTLYKYRGDAEVGRAFNSTFSKTIEKSYKFIDFVIPIPLSIERLYDRGFNQCEIWLEKVPNKLSNCLVRTQHEEKQSKKTRHERVNRSVEMFRVANDHLIKDKTLLIVDDLYTTGTTVYQAADVLVKSGAKDIYSLTLCRS